MNFSLFCHFQDEISRGPECVEVISEEDRKIETVLSKQGCFETENGLKFRDEVGKLQKNLTSRDYPLLSVPGDEEPKHLGPTVDPVCVSEPWDGLAKHGQPRGKDTHLRIAHAEDIPQRGRH